MVAQIGEKPRSFTTTKRTPVKKKTRKTSSSDREKIRDELRRQQIERLQAGESATQASIFTAEQKSKARTVAATRPDLPPVDLSGIQKADGKPIITASTPKGRHLGQGTFTGSKKDLSRLGVIKTPFEQLAERRGVNIQKVGRALQAEREQRTKILEKKKVTSADVIAGIEQFKPIPEKKKTPFFSMEGGTLKIGPKTKIGQKLTSIGEYLGPSSTTEAALMVTPIGTIGKGAKVYKGAKTLTKARAAAKAGAWLERAAPKAYGAGKKILQTSAGRFLKDIGIATAEGVTIVKASDIIGRQTATKEQKEIFKMKGFETVLETAYQEEAASQGKWYKRVAYEISPFFSSSKETFPKSVERQLTDLGLSPEKVKTGVQAAQRQRKFLGGGEAIANLNIARYSERAGRREVAKVFERAAAKGETIVKQRSFGTLFKKTFIPISKAGFVEGFGSEITQQTAREQPFQIKPALIQGGIGGAFAGLIGGTIAGTSVKSPKISKAIELPTYIVDPFEKPGDVLADIQSGMSKRLGRTVTPGPIITETVKAEDILSIKSTAPTKGKTKVKTPSNILSFGTPTGVPTPVPTSVPVSVPVPSKKTPTSVPVPTIIGTVTSTPTPVPTSVPINMPTSVPVSIPTSMPVSVSVPVSIPTLTPQPRIPPPLPLQFPAFGSSTGNIRKGSKRFIGELSHSRKLLAEMVGGGWTSSPKRSTSKKSRKKVKKRGQDFFNIFPEINIFGVR